MGPPKLFGEMKLRDKQKILPPNSGEADHLAGAVISLATGRTNWNRAPLLPSDVAESWPPWLSMILRQMANPSPMPSVFVVTNASKMPSSCFGINSGSRIFDRDNNRVASRSSFSPAALDFDRTWSPSLRSHFGSG